MKTPFFVFAALLLFMAGCATSNKTQEARTTETREVQPNISPGTQFALLPSPVQVTIRAQAGASQIADIRKIPSDGHDIYEVTFRNHPTLYIADNGDMVNASNVGGVGTPMEIPGSGTGGDLMTNLPSAVQRTLHEAAPDATVANVQRQQRTVYEITFQDPGRHPGLLIASDGTILRQTPY